MTTVLIDVDAGLIAADKQRTCSNEYDWFIEMTSKIFIVKENMIFVGSGDSNTLDDLFNYYIKHDIAPKYLNGHVNATYSLIQKFPDGTILARTYVTEHYRSFFRKRTRIIQDSYNYRGNIAFGSGGGYALGAYEVCKDMVKSIEAASTYDKGTGLGVDVFDMNTFEFLKL